MNNWRVHEKIEPSTRRERIMAFGVEVVVSCCTRTIDTRVAYGDMETDGRGTVFNWAGNRHKFLGEIVRYWTREKGGDCLTLKNPRNVVELFTDRQNRSARQQIYWTLRCEHRYIGENCVAAECVVARWLVVHKELDSRATRSAK